MQSISLVIPVYCGENALPSLIEEILPITSAQTTPSGIPFIISEVLLVHDCGPNHSYQTIERLSSQHSFIHPIWLSRNYGKHPATLAGMASTTGDWVVTMDEDGRQNPRDIGTLLDKAMCSFLQLVYAQPENPVNECFSSRAAKLIAETLLGNKANSFRLIDGEIARTLSAYCGNGVYLDAGLSWITARIGYAPVKLREEKIDSSSESNDSLINQYWKIALTKGTRLLRLISFIGIASVLFSIGLSLATLYSKYLSLTPVQGWTLLVIAIAFFSGCLLMALGVIAEYLAATMGILMGKPLYVITTKPTRQE